MKVLSTLVLLMSMAPVVAQDLVIDNARVIVGTGEVIGNGHIVVRDGRIASVGAGRAGEYSLTKIDARGRTAMPGLIDAHWHLTVGAPATSDVELQQFVDTVVAAELHSLLSRGVTTIMTAGDHYPQVMNIRERVNSGEFESPRLLVVGPVLTSPNDWPTQICSGNEYCLEFLNAELDSEDGSRALVSELAAAGVDAIKLVYDDRIAPDVRIDDSLVAAIADEAKQNELTLFVHVSTVEETALRVVNLGAGRLVHPVPLRSAQSEGGVERIAELGVAVSTTVGAMSPEWSARIGRDHTDTLQDEFLRRLEDIGQLHDNGVVVAFGTDSVAGDTSMSGHYFMAEVNALARIMSNEEVIASLTRNAAIYLEKDDDIGTLQPGKVADILILDGDPLEDLADLAKVDIVIQSGGIAFQPFL